MCATSQSSDILPYTSFSKRITNSASTTGLIAVPGKGCNYVVLRSTFIDYIFRHDNKYSSRKKQQKERSKITIRRLDNRENSTEQKRTTYNAMNTFNRPPGTCRIKIVSLSQYDTSC